MPSSRDGPENAAETPRTISVSDTPEVAARAIREHNPGPAKNPLRPERSAVRLVRRRIARAVFPRASRGTCGRPVMELVLSESYSLPRRQFSASVVPAEPVSAIQVLSNSLDSHSCWRRVRLTRRVPWNAPRDRTQHAVRFHRCRSNEDSARWVQIAPLTSGFAPDRVLGRGCHRRA